MSTRPCPVCDRTSVRLLLRQSFEELSEGSLLSGYDVVICENCGAGFADNIPAQSAFDAYYASFSKYEYAHRGGEESPADKARLERLAGEISAFIPAADSPTLDIGSGNGKLVAALHQLGFKNARGVDPSPACARTGRELYGVEVLTHTIFDLPQDRQYDLISLFGVLEHIRDVRRAVDNLPPSRCSRCDPLYRGPRLRQPPRHPGRPLPGIQYRAHQLPLALLAFQPHPQRRMGRDFRPPLSRLQPRPQLIGRRRHLSQRPAEELCHRQRHRDRARAHPLH